MEKTPYYSYRIGKLAKGCNECVKGNKSVYFITGLCSSDCFFCPISDEKKNKDVIYINEWPTKKTRDISREIELCSSTGVGMTGGDPLLCMDRTVKAIRLLKKKIDFHIHLYTPLDHVDRKKLARLAAAGLDEIRFHPDIDDDRLWERLELAREFDWDVGIEIPVIPGKLRETKRLLDFIAGKVDFLNLNELEFSDTNYNRILEHGFKAKDDLSYAVKGSDPMAKALLRYVERKGLKLRVHYCTAKLKDKVQLSGRMKRRSSKASLPFDIVTEDGLLIRGAIYLPELFPGFDYRKRLLDVDRDEVLGWLKAWRSSLIKQFSLPKEMIAVDEVKLRLLIHPAILSEIHKEIDGRSAIVTEYPTYDMFEVEIQELI